MISSSTTADGARGAAERPARHLDAAAMTQTPNLVIPDAAEQS
jgi:hypothetical protein